MTTATQSRAEAKASDGSGILRHGKLNSVTAEGLSLMNRVRKILVPVNFSDDSANGLNCAASLAQETQAELVVLHVTNRKEAHYFLSYVAMMEGWPALNTSSAIPVDTLVQEKALDLYVYRKGHHKPRPGENQKKGRSRARRGKNCRHRYGRKYRSRGAWHSQ